MIDSLRSLTVFRDAMLLLATDDVSPEHWEEWTLNSRVALRDFLSDHSCSPRVRQPFLINYNQLKPNQAEHSER
jgi:hypothetical protein